MGGGNGRAEFGRGGLEIGFLILLEIYLIIECFLKISKNDGVAYPTEYIA